MKATKTQSVRHLRPRPCLIVVSAPSAAGKTTLCGMVLQAFPQIVRSVSVTTRPQRPGEKNGVDYFFVSEDEFRKTQNRGEFAETAFVHNHWYGTLKKTIEQHLGNGKHVMFPIDVQGAMSLQQIYRNRVLLIFVHPPSLEILRKRLLERKEDSLNIETRLQNAYNELEWSRKFDYQILNDDLTSAFEELKKIIQRECLE